MTAEVFVSADGPPDGPPVVLAGSLGSTHEMWDPQVEALSNAYRVLAYDTRGHGRSPVPAGPYSIDDLADDLLGVLDRFGIGRAHVVGLSLGGMTALRTAARNPDRVASLTVLCTSALLGPARGWSDRAALVRRAGTRAVAEATVGRWLTAGYAEANPGVVASMVQMVAATPPEGYAACCEAIGAMDLRGDLGRVTAPTLAIAGSEDPATPPEHLRAITDAVTGARFLELSPGAHLTSWERADAVTEALRTHIEDMGGA